MQHEPFGIFLLKKNDEWELFINNYSFKDLQAREKNQSKSFCVNFEAVGALVIPMGTQFKLKQKTPEKLEVSKNDQKLEP